MEREATNSTASDSSVFKDGSTSEVDSYLIIPDASTSSFDATPTGIKEMSFTEHTPKPILKETSNVPVPMPRSILKSSDTLEEPSQLTIVEKPSETELEEDFFIKNQEKNPEQDQVIQEFKDKSKSLTEIKPSEFTKVVTPSENPDDEKTHKHKKHSKSKKSTKSKSSDEKVEKKHKKRRKSKKSKSTVVALAVAEDNGLVLHEALEPQKEIITEPILEQQPLMDAKLNNVVDQPPKSILKKTKSVDQPDVPIKDSVNHLPEQLRINPNTIDGIRSFLEPYIGEPVESRVAFIGLGVVVVGISVYFARAAKAS